MTEIFHSISITYRKWMKDDFRTSPVPFSHSAPTYTLYII